MLGQIIGNYRVVAELGRGGMGVVYRAEHVQLGRPAALKVLLPRMSSDAQIVQRFFNEARAASSIDHPGIIEVYDFGRHTDGSAYLVMELLKGESLDHRLMRPIAPLEAASLIAQVAGALAAAHARGIIHRDLKPDNIFLVPNELLPGGIQVKLLDFGIAKLADEGASGFRTQTGVLIGTPAYMSPEQCMGRPDLDHRTDLYAVGCILFHMLCGRPPFYSEQGTGVMIAMHLRDPVPDPRSLAPHLPQALVGIMLRLLEKEPAARFQSAQELRQALVAAGAIAPMTAPNAGAGAGAGADPHGATMAPAPAPAPPAGARSGPPSMPGAPAGSPGPAGYGYGPTEAYGATAAGYGPQGAYAPTAGLGPSPTTRSGAAAELMTQPERVRNRGPAVPAAAAARARGGGRRTAWIVVGALLIAGGGVTAGVALSGGGGGDGGDRDAESQAKQPAGPAGPATGPDREARAARAAIGSGSGPGSGPEEVKPVVPPRPPPPPLPPQQQPETKTATAEAPCPAGQLRGEDTRGECCWAGQAWSTAKKRCVGAPTCPPGTRASGEQCVAAPAEADPGQRAPHGGPHIAADDPLALPPAPPPELLLAGTSFPPGAPIAIRFTPAIRSTPGRRAWVTVAPAGSPQTSYGTWTFVDDGARAARLAAPPKPGAYEVRLHTDYPARSFHVVRAAAFTVAAAAEVATDQAAPDGPTPLSGQRFTLGAPSARAGGSVAVRFPGPLRAAPGEQFWITVIEAGEADTGWGKWEYVPKAARSMTLAVPDKAGAYEVRLHANYPKKSANVVFRRPLRVDGD